MVKPKNISKLVVFTTKGTYSISAGMAQDRCTLNCKMSISSAALIRNRHLMVLARPFKRRTRSRLLCCATNNWTDNHHDKTKKSQGKLENGFLSCNQEKIAQREHSDRYIPYNGNKNLYYIYKFPETIRKLSRNTQSKLNTISPSQFRIAWVTQPIAIICCKVIFTLWLRSWTSSRLTSLYMSSVLSQFELRPDELKLDDL